MVNVQSRFNGIAVDGFEVHTVWEMGWRWEGCGSHVPFDEAC